MEQQEIPPTVTMVPVEEPSEQEQTTATKSVKNFWERLDEVFTQTSGLRDKLDEIVDQFPTEAQSATPYRSYVFQPERISITSNEDAEPSVNLAEVNQGGGHQGAELFSQFRVRFQKSLINVKSLQLLSCVIPNAIQNLPDYSLCFFYYKLRNVATSQKGVWNSATLYNPGDFVTFFGNTFVCLQQNTNYQPTGVQLGVWWNPVTLPADTTRPNYYDLNEDNLSVFALYPTYRFPPETFAVVDDFYYNRSFEDYASLVTALNSAQTLNPGLNVTPGDVQFVYDQTLNKIQMVPDPAQIAAGYYFLPAGYEDPNVVGKEGAIQAFFPGGIYRPGYTLNLRCGFTWNGLFPNPFSSPSIWNNTQFRNALYWYMRPIDPVFATAYTRQIITANSYPDLVNTSCVKVYCDLTAGSTEEGQIYGQQQQTGLLSIVPVNTTNLGVGFYQNNFNNPLTKVPRIISEIQIRLVNDQGQPFTLPNSATVLLELGITYH